MISGIADQQIDELVKATQRVESAKKELAEAQEQEIEARKTMEYMNQLETRDFEVRFFFIYHKIMSFYGNRN